MTEMTDPSLPKTLRAACLVAPGRIELQQITAAEPGPRDVLVRPSAVGLCGTDFHIHSGAANYHRDALGAEVSLESQPQVLGHEIAGVVEAVGPGAPGVKVGDRVVVDQGLNCRSAARAKLCEYCGTGDSHQCEHYAEHGITGLPGGLSEALVVPAVNTVRLRSDLAAENAALCEPLACVLHTLEVVRRARTRYALGGRRGGRPVESIVITGAGPAGLLFVQALRQVFGFQGQLLITDPNPVKRALAEQFGATALDPTGGPAGGDLREQVLEATAGRRAELLIEASGAGSVFEDVPWLVRKQATVVMYGYGHGSTGLDVFNALQFREPVIVTTTGASGGFDTDGRPALYRRALTLIEQARVETAPLITHRYAGLESVPAAFSGDHRAADYIKGVVLL